MTHDPQDHRTAPLPRSDATSAWPATVAFGLVGLAAGLLTFPPVALAGAAVTGWGAWRWIRETGTDEPVKASERNRPAPLLVAALAAAHALVLAALFRAAHAHGVPSGFGAPAVLASLAILVAAPAALLALRLRGAAWIAAAGAAAFAAATFVGAATGDATASSGASVRFALFAWHGTAGVAAAVAAAIVARRGAHRGSLAAGLVALAVAWFATALVLALGRAGAGGHA